MRKIKFRLWDQVAKKMVHDLPAHFIINLEDGELIIGGDAPNGDWYEPVVMQFTGIHDKKGKEIYEGDIMKFVGIVESIEEIVWDDGCFVQKVKGNPEHKIIDKNTSRGEIIGNIYKNEKLLNV